MVNTLVTNWFSLQSKFSFFLERMSLKLIILSWNSVQQCNLFFLWLTKSVCCQPASISVDFISPLICHDIPLDGCTVGRNQLSLKFPGEVRLWMKIKLHLLFSSFWPGRVWKQAVRLFSLQKLHFFVPYGYIYVLCWVSPLTAFKSRMVSVPEKEQFPRQAGGLSLILEKWQCF